MFASEQDGTSAFDSTPVTDSSNDAAETLTADATERGDPSDTSGDATAGPPRDDHGRFAPRTPQDGSTTATDTDPDGDQDAPATDDPDAPAATSDPAAGDPTAAPTAPPGTGTADPSGGRPFTFAHRGQQYAVDGALVKPDGSLVIPPASRARVELMMTRAREHEVMGPQVHAQHQREVATLRSQVEQRHAGVEAFGKLLEGNPDPETFLARALAFYEQLPQLREEMTRDELAARDRRIAELEGRATPTSTTTGQPAGGATAEDLAQAIHTNTGQMLLRAREAMPAFRDFTDQELVAMQPAMIKRATLYVRGATAEDEQRYGVPAGDPVFDADAFAHELTLVAGETIRQKQAAAQRAKVKPALDAAQQRNAAVLSRPKAPPVPRPAAEVGATGSDEEFDDYDQWKAQFGMGARRRS